MVKFNLIGFSFNNNNIRGYEEFQHCAIHTGIRLLKDKEDSNMLFCPTCGNRYPLKDTVRDQDAQSAIPPSTATTTKIISQKRKTKHYDSFANLIPEDDKEAMADLASGKKIVFYHSSVDESTKPKKEVRRPRRRIR